MTREPAPFTADDYAARMAAAAQTAADAGLAGLLISPGPTSRTSRGTGPPPRPSG